VARATAATYERQQLCHRPPEATAVVILGELLFRHCINIYDFCDYLSLEQ
jgi:hypothetical protein